MDTLRVAAHPLGVALPIALQKPLRMGVPASTGGGWSPLSLGASLLAWWTADRADLITLSGSQVTSWRDVKNGYNAVQGTGSLRPLYSATSFNGAPGLTFDGVDDYLELASQPFPSGSSTSGIWVISSQDALAASAGSRILVSYGGDTTATRRGIQRNSSGSANTLAGVVGDGVSTLSPAVAGDFSGRTLSRLKSGINASLAQFNTTVGSIVTGTPATGTSRLRIGAISNASPGNYWNGLVRDVIITADLSAEQVQNLQTFLLPRRML